MHTLFLPHETRRNTSAYGFGRRVNEGTFIVWKFIAFDGLKKAAGSVVARHYGSVSLREGEEAKGKVDHEGGKDG